MILCDGWKKGRTGGNGNDIWSGVIKRIDGRWSEDRWIVRRWYMKIRHYKKELRNFEKGILWSE